MKILEADYVPNQMVKELQSWNEKEWGKDAFKTIHKTDIIIPSPVVAVDDNNKLLGGSTFISGKIPNSTEFGTWINTVIVSPTHRRKGIASKLIISAQVTAQKVGVSELFVLTELPALYRKLGWENVVYENSDNDYILKKNVTNATHR